jgi:hypothetical protein
MRKADVEFDRAGILGFHDISGGQKDLEMGRGLPGKRTQAEPDE